jgi:hypothetical protein
VNGGPSSPIPFLSCGLLLDRRRRAEPGPTFRREHSENDEAVEGIAWTKKDALDKIVEDERQDDADDRCDKALILEAQLSAPT